MARPTKKSWTKPEVKRFDTPEELLAHYRGRGSAAEREKLDELLDEARTKASQERPRRNANG